MTDRDDERLILSLYEDGYSVKDIALALQISRTGVKRILTDKGFETGSYRALPSQAVRVLDILAAFDVSYRLIADVSDISYDAIRCYYRRIGHRRMSWSRTCPKPETHALDQAALQDCVRMYAAGSSLPALTDGLSDDQVYELFYELSLSDRRSHKKALKDGVRRDFDKGFPPSAIAKRRRISCSSVREIIRNI